MPNSKSKYTSKTAVVVYVASTLTSVWGGMEAWDNIHGKLDGYIESHVHDALKNRKGGFRSELSKEIGVPKEDISREFARVYRWAVDSMELFHGAVMPMLREEMVTVDVGLKIYKDRNDDRVWYRHTDGELYRAFYDTRQKKYYFNNRLNENEWCK